MKVNNSIPLLAFFGHHKAASSWIESIIVNICEDMGLKHGVVDRPSLYNYTYPQPRGYVKNTKTLSTGQTVDDLKKFVDAENIDFLTYTNAEIEYVMTLENFQGFHVVRDPRDIVVSAYFSHLYSHQTDIWPELIDHRRELEELSQDEGLLLEMECRRKDFENMYTWNYKLPNVYEIRMEELTQNSYQILLTVLQFLGIIDERNFNLNNRFSYLIKMSIRRHLGIQLPMHKMPAERVLGIIYEKDFTRNAKGRKPGEENLKSHYRKGVAGDWKNHFNEKHISYFKNNYNDLLVKLNYESDQNW